MAGHKDLKEIAKKRLNAVKILINANDWETAAYLMGLTLECALKAATCKTLKLQSYPANTRKKEIDSYFMTHKFDQLLVVSGLSEVFSLNGEPDEFKNWSEFTIEYPGDWPSMRYDQSKIWDESKVKRLYDNLIDPQHGVIAAMKRNKKW